MRSRKTAKTGRELPRLPQNPLFILWAEKKYLKRTVNLLSSTLKVFQTCHRLIIRRSRAYSAAFLGRQASLRNVISMMWWHVATAESMFFKIAFKVSQKVGLCLIVMM